jgi:hypothetical protein
MGAVDPSVYDSVSIAETSTHIATVNCINAPYDGVTLTESVTTPTFALKLYKGTNSVTVSLITMDWSLVETLRQYRSSGIPLKGIIFIPGGTDTFSIKDLSDSGAYLYKGALAATTVLVYPGSYCKPYIDFSECSLNSGHMITFVW